MKKIKTLLVVLSLVLCLGFNTITASAWSPFYSLSGSSNISWAWSGVGASVITSASADVDFIQAYGHLYLYGTLVRTLLWSENDTDYTYATTSYDAYGSYALYGQHNSSDWSGDYEIYSYKSYIR